MKQHRILTFCLILAATAQSLSAATQSPEATVTTNPKVMTLRDCMNHAVEFSTQMRIQRAETAQAQINHRDAIIKAFTPEIGASTGADLGYGRILDPDTNTYIDADAMLTASMGAYASINLFNGFSAINNIKFNNTLLKMGADNEEVTRAKICLATMEAYYNVVYYSRLAGIQQNQIETAKESLRLVEKQEELGTKAASDIIEIKAQIADREYEYISTENKRKDALITLKDLMFWDPAEELNIDCEVSGEEYITLSDPTAEQDIVEFATQNQASAKVALGQMQNARLALTSARLAILPSLSAGAGIQSRFGTPVSNIDRTSISNQINQNTQKYISLQLSIPIFTRFNYLTNVGKKKIEYEKASAQYDQKIRDIEAEVHRAIQDRDGASSAYLQAERKAELQKETYNINIKKYDQGLISAIELQTATDNYLKSEADKYSTLFKYIIKKHVVNYYNGINFLEQ